MRGCLLALVAVAAPRLPRWPDQTAAPADPRVLRHKDRCGQRGLVARVEAGRGAVSPRVPMGSAVAAARGRFTPISPFGYSACPMAGFSCPDGADRRLALLRRLLRRGRNL